MRNQNRFSSHLKLKFIFIKIIYTSTILLLAAILSTANAHPTTTHTTKNIHHTNKKNPRIIKNPIKTPHKTSNKLASLHKKNSPPLPSHTTPPAINNTLLEKTIVVHKKDTLNKIFLRLKLNPLEAKAILKLRHANALHNLHSGQKLLFQFFNNKLEKIILAINSTDTLIVTRNKNYFQAQINHIKPIEYTRCAVITINKSIYASAKKANIPQALIAKFINAFSNKVNVTKILRNGDKIALLYKDQLINGKKINKTSELIAAEYIHGKEVKKIIKFTDDAGNNNFYTAEGYSLNPPFMRYPLKFKRIGSLFSFNRLNPVSGIYCKHTGVDLCASIGTPINATSDGTIIFAGRNGGYGNAAIIKHGQYTTLYGHMLKFAPNVCVGCRIYKGDVIGYVGMTGRTTGPHVHYEFRINNIPYDPLKVKLPDGEMIAQNYRAKFFKQSKKLFLQLDSIMYASTEKNNSPTKIFPAHKKGKTALLLFVNPMALYQQQIEG